MWKVRDFLRFLSVLNVFYPFLDSEGSRFSQIFYCTMWVTFHIMNSWIMNFSNRTSTLLWNPTNGIPSKNSCLYSEILRIFKCGGSRPGANPIRWDETFRWLVWMVGDSSSFVNVVCISLLVWGATVDWFPRHRRVVWQHGWIPSLYSVSRGLSPTGHKMLIAL